MVPAYLLTAREAAKVLSISERTLYSLTKRGEIPVIKLGGAVRYDPDAIRKWIGEHSKKAGR